MEDADDDRYIVRKTSYLFSTSSSNTYGVNEKILSVEHITNSLKLLAKVRDLMACNQYNTIVQYSIFF
jgi:hypothetical protein